MSEYELNASQNNFSHRIDILKELIDQANNKINHIDNLRQANFSLALLIFAGLISFGLSQSEIFIQCCIAIVLPVFMIILSNYDHDLHRYLHGWGRTKVNLIINLSSLINCPDTNLNLKTYYKEGELRAVKENCDNFKIFRFYINNLKKKNKDIKVPSKMRVVYYMLVRGAFFTIGFYLLTKII